MTGGTTSSTVAVLLAAVPVLVILALMLGWRWSAARAGLVGLALAGMLAPSAFGFGGASAHGLAGEFAAVGAEGAFMAATILWILWPALALHHHQQQRGAIDAIRSGLGRLTAGRSLQALLVGWFLALFFEGAAGFGTPVALTAPILVGLGIPAVQAVVLALLGHAAGVSFGALGTPVLAQVALTGLDAVDIAWRTALLHALLGGLLMLFFMRVLATGVNADKPDQAREVLPLAWPVLAAGSFLLPSLALAALLGPELATLGGALAGGAIFTAVLRWRTRGHANPRPAPGLGRALWPYGVLIALVLFTRAPPVSGLLASVKLHWQWAGGYGGSMQPLVHPGTLLLLALLIGARLQHVPFKDAGSSLAHAARQLLPVSAALLAMLCLSRLMLHAGMIAALQDAAVSGLGHSWSLVAPAVGALGSFVTGSATASNVLFTSLQAQTAQALGLPVALMVAAQGFGAAIGNIVCPHNIIAGAATVGLAGREADILRHTLWPCAMYLVAGGLLVAGLAIW